MSENEGFDNTTSEEGHESEEPWLVSYADMMTLLFGFFVIMYTFEAAKNKEKGPDAMEAMRQKVSEYFGGEYITPMKEVASSFLKKVGENTQTKNIEMKMTPEGFRVMLSSSTFFELGSAELFPGSKKTIESLIKEIAAYQEAEKIPPHHVKVEGHTDDIPLRQGGRYPSNWELSSARASSIIRMFESMGFPPKNLMAIGYGSTRPAHPNRDEAGKPIPENQQKNRRVVITIHEPPESALRQKESN